MYQDLGYYTYPNYQMYPGRVSRGIFGGLFRRGGNFGGANYGIRPKFDWGNFLSNTQKTLNVVNQAIPIFYQIKPIFNNAKTMFRIMGALKDDDQDHHPQEQETVLNSTTDKHEAQFQENQPQFFL